LLLRLAQFDFVTLSVMIMMMLEVVVVMEVVLWVITIF